MFRMKVGWLCTALAYGLFRAAPGPTLGTNRFHVGGFSLYFELWSLPLANNEKKITSIFLMAIFFLP